MCLFCLGTCIRAKHPIYYGDYLYFLGEIVKRKAQDPTDYASISIAQNGTCKQLLLISHS